ncbi:hypothetical protein FGO68_gene5378 [Halteria grandinella]|uniref:Uncharacterized protein n=1 Tax=Halteria grandinella TaxID=5974 RepID=A0A8J8P1Z6_HALGN|nr:hypothetical protein FGO68_gene5378 [Halteria grandinella]
MKVLQQYFSIIPPANGLVKIYACQYSHLLRQIRIFESQILLFQGQCYLALSNQKCHHVLLIFSIFHKNKIVFLRIILINPIDLIQIVIYEFISSLPLYHHQVNLFIFEPYSRSNFQLKQQYLLDEIQMRITHFSLKF